jgi:hypothetical protein
MLDFDALRDVDASTAGTKSYQAELERAQGVMRGVIVTFYPHIPFILRNLMN